MRQLNGEFVLVEGSSLGLGKLRSLSKTRAEISYFASPARGEAHRVDVARGLVSVVNLIAQTRVYWFDPVKRSWSAGRVAEGGRIEGRLYGHDEDLYLIELPNRQVARIPISVLRVRWARPVDDPVAYLAACTTQTPFWHLRRRRFLRQAVEQRVRCGAFVGLWSAAVELHQHQLRAVQTVLADPVQRYLLADEVGLGKTIEAAAILRQYVLDHPDEHQALVLVPPHLVEQWREELRSRFYLGCYLDDSVRVESVSDPAAVTGAPGSLGMLIVDEAHHPASMAFSTCAEEREVYADLAKLARRTPRLLLLSGTPVLRNEDGFLAMLHLLEPDAYPLEDRAAFRHRVHNRQKLAESLSDLQPDTPSFFLEDTLDALVGLTAGDQQVLHLIDRTRLLLDADEEDVERQRAIRNLREHVSEVFRLHRRLIRHRRETVRDVLRGRAGAEVVAVDDDLRALIGERLEVWRVEANLHLDESAGEVAVVRSLYWLLLESAMSHPMVLIETVAARRAGRAPDVRLMPAMRIDLEVLHAPPVFPDEAEVLDTILAAGTSAGLPRLDALEQVVKAGAKRGESTIVFADAPYVADTVAHQLSQARVSQVVRHQLGVSLDSFFDGGPGVLVCDRLAEEGLNLQQTRAQIVHFDLPLNAGRIEQRIGRIDRAAARAKARSVVFFATDACLEAWRICLQHTVRVFDRSVASLQYVLEDELRTLQASVFEHGIEAFQEMAERLDDPQGGLEAELRKIRTQEQLDAITEAADDDAEEFEDLDEFDADADGFQQGFDAWVTEALQCSRFPDERRPGVLRYGYALNGRRRALLPVDEFLNWCADAIDESARVRAHATHRLTFSRSIALRERVELARIGHAFVDGLIEYTRRDDRGVAFGMWRHRTGLSLPAEPWLVFGFDYLIEAEHNSMQSAEEMRRSGSAIRRRLDAVLPPRYATIWIDQDLEVITDPSLLAVLEEPFSTTRSARGGDWNLSARWASILPRLDLGTWEALCIQAAEMAAQQMDAQLGLADEAQRALERIQDDLVRRRIQLKARLTRLPSDRLQSEQHTLDLEERFAEGAAKAVQSPRVSPASAFAIVLSSAPIAGPSA